MYGRKVMLAAAHCWALCGLAWLGYALYHRLTDVSAGLVRWATGPLIAASIVLVTGVLLSILLHKQNESSLGLFSKLLNVSIGIVLGLGAWCAVLWGTASAYGRSFAASATEAFESPYALRLSVGRDLSYTVRLSSDDPEKGFNKMVLSNRSAGTAITLERSDYYGNISSVFEIPLDRLIRNRPDLKNHYVVMSCQMLGVEDKGPTVKDVLTSEIWGAGVPEFTITSKYMVYDSPERQEFWMMRFAPVAPTKNESDTSTVYMDNLASEGTKYKLDARRTTSQDKTGLSVSLGAFVSDQLFARKFTKGSEDIMASVSILDKEGNSLAEHSIDIDQLLAVGKTWATAPSFFDVKPAAAAKSINLTFDAGPFGGAQKISAGIRP